MKKNNDITTFSLVLQSEKDSAASVKKSKKKDKKKKDEDDFTNIQEEKLDEDLEESPAKVMILFSILLIL